MSGVFGIISSNTTDLGKITGKMSQSLCHRDWYVTDSYTNNECNLSIGRIGIGIFNKKPQPFWNDRHNAALFMAGEFYQTHSIGHPDDAGKESLALSYYEKYGYDFAKYLNGAFVIVIFDQEKKQLVITNDRFGLYPLYYSTWKKQLIFSPELKGILETNQFPRNLDFTALAQYMRFQHLLGCRTFFEDIHLFPAGSILQWDISKCDFELRNYWSFQAIPYFPNIKFNEAVEEVSSILRKSIERLSGDSYRPGVFLSGGLDSRTILGLTKRRPIVSINWGAKNCRDVRISKQIAKAVGSDHHWFDLSSGNWVIENEILHMELTEGFHSWIHAHGISVLPAARQIMDVNLTGWDGGTVMGHIDSIEPLQISAVDNMAFSNHIFNRFVQNYTWPSISEVEEQCLYTEKTKKAVQNLAFESFTEELKPYLNYRHDIRGEIFYIVNHCCRLTHNMVTTGRSHIEFRFPFFDYDLIDFLYSIPSNVRGNRTLYKALIQKTTPRLSLIPYDHDEFLPTNNKFLRISHATAIKTIRRIKNIFGAKNSQNTLYSDYENYLRGDLKKWGENILFSPEVEQHDIFNQEFIHSIWARHQSGLEEWTIGKIAPIMTYEMMLRHLYD